MGAAFLTHPCLLTAYKQDYFYESKCQGNGRARRWEANTSKSKILHLLKIIHIGCAHSPQGKPYSHTDTPLHQEREHGNFFRVALSDTECLECWRLREIPCMEKFLGKGPRRFLGKQGLNASPPMTMGLVSVTHNYF